MVYSIGIPAFKVEFLSECIQSVLAQTFTDLELIIVNDASPHDIKSVVGGFSDNRIRYYENETNIGAEHVVDNWNICLKHARGEYFILMGDDDVMELNYLEEINSLISKYPGLDVFHCRSYIINEQSEKIRLTPSWPEYESVYENMWHRISSMRLQYISDFIYDRASLLEKQGFHKFPLAWASDDVSAYIAAADKGIAHTNQPLFNYRRNQFTISSTGSFDLKMKAIDELEGWFNSFMRERKPTNNVDMVFYEMLQKDLPRFFQKKRIRTIALSYHAGFFTAFFKWYRNRKKNKMTTLHVFYSVFEYLKNKKSGQ